MISEQDRDWIHAKLDEILKMVEHDEADGPKAKYNSESFKAGLRYGVQRIREEVAEKI